MRVQLGVARMIVFVFMSTPTERDRVVALHHKYVNVQRNEFKATSMLPLVR